LGVDTLLIEKKQVNKNMESYSYYKLKNENRISKIKSDLEESRTPELIKEFVGKEDENLNSVIKNIIEINDISNINKEVNKWKISIHPMYIDLIKEFYELNENAVNNIDKIWISSFKSLANKIVWEIRLNKNKSKNYEFHLNQSLLIGIQL
jgi:hypothetical protein